MIYLIADLFKQVLQFSHFKIYPIEHFRLFIEELRQNKTLNGISGKAKKRTLHQFIIYQ
jgi:hypothetical protein